VIKPYGAAIREAPAGDARILVMAACNDVLEVQESRGGRVGNARIAAGANPGPVDCRGATTFPVGSQVAASVPTGCLRLRREPSRDAPYDYCVPNGHRYQVVDGPREVGGGGGVPMSFVKRIWPEG
jgi:hypothetical protein